MDANGQRVSDVAVSLIRTWVPIGVGAVVAWLAASRHVVLPAHASAALGAFAAAACAAAYYGIARALEHAKGASMPAKLARTLGRYLLGGVMKTPIYVPAHEP